MDCFAPHLVLSQLRFGVVVFCCLLGGAQRAVAVTSNQSLVSAMQELARAPTATRAAFVEATVAELASAYRAAAQAGGQGGKRGKQAKNAKTWKAGTQAYVARLQRAAAAARAGAPVQLLVDRGRSMRVLVGRHPVRQFIISAPTAKGRPALERAILRRLCAVTGCGPKPSLAAPSEPLLTATTSAAPVRPSLPLTPAPPRIVTTLPNSDGLRCAQEGVRHQVLYDNACKALLGDVRALIKALHGQARSGVQIDWRSPSRPYPKGAQFTLAINGRGDSVSLPLALLGAAPELLVDILPWAEQRLFGRFRILELRLPERLVYSAAVALR